MHAPTIVVIRSDGLRKRIIGEKPETPLDPSAYSPGTNVEVYRWLLSDAGHAIRTGTSVILDASFLKSAWRDAVDDLAEKANVRFHGLWLSITVTFLISDAFAALRPDALVSMLSMQ